MKKISKYRIGTCKADAKKINVKRGRIILARSYDAALEAARGIFQRDCKAGSGRAVWAQFEGVAN